MIAALLLAAQLSLFAHAIGHDYLQDADQGHVVCGLCIAAHHLDHGLASASIELPHGDACPFDLTASSQRVHATVPAAFQARAPPALLAL